MGDLIDRDALKKAIGKVYACDWDDIEKNFYFAEAVNSLPSAETERKWIPVTEALPINDVDVIVSILDNSGDTPYRFTSVGWCTPNGQYWVVDNEMCYGVIAWMPLPEAWRGE